MGTQPHRGFGERIICNNRFNKVEFCLKLHSINTLGALNLVYRKTAICISGFTFDLFGAETNMIGALCWPDVPVAANARLKNVIPESLSKRIEIKIGEQNYEIAFEYLTRDWFNDIRFTLMDGDIPLALADIVKSKKMFACKNINVLAPFEGEVIRKSTLFTTR